MTGGEMIAFARAIADGGKVNKGEVVAFMKALVAEGQTDERTADGEAAHVIAPGQPGATYGSKPAASPHVKVSRTGAVHVSCSAFFDKGEARALAYAILAAAGA
jgi:hypothetical protein